MNGIHLCHIYNKYAITVNGNVQTDVNLTSYTRNVGR